MTSVHNLAPATSSGGPWRLAPVVVLRQAGFPMELLAPLADTAAFEEATSLLRRRSDLLALADRVKSGLRQHRAAGSQQISSQVGQLQPVPDETLRRVATDVPEHTVRVVQTYQMALEEFGEGWAKFVVRHHGRLDGARAAVLSAFGDERLRQVLLLSNDAAYPGFADWLDTAQADMGRHAKKMTDLLAMYLQRITTKNETNSHFGPITTGRIGDMPGISWSSVHEIERRAYCSHWAAEKLAAVAAATPGLHDYIRPRRRPLAFLRDGRIDLYAFTTRDGLETDWDFQHLAGQPVSEHEEWLWTQCDGEKTIRELRAEWNDRKAPPEVGFEHLLERLVTNEWITAEFEIPVGDPHPLAALRQLLVGVPDELAAPILPAVVRLEEDLTQFAKLPLNERPVMLAGIKERFENLTGYSANRYRGLHYADRSVLFEEAHSGLMDLTIGPDIARFITDELSIVYELVLARPRLRMRRELDILTRWVVARFGSDVIVPLDRLYAEFFRDRGVIAAECAVVEAELAAVDEAIAAALFVESGPDQAEAVVPRERIEAILGTYPSFPAAVCNPDVLFASASMDALRQGQFTAVIGDCHAVREVNTHTSFSHLVQERAPELLAEIYQGYLSLLEDDEILADLSRGHPDKTSTQLRYPCYDLEVYGRSAHPRGQVLQPSRLYVVVRGGRLELGARGVDGRIRLMAPPAGGPSIRQDPLSPFAFPRHFGGAGLAVPALTHVPRIRCGRVVIQRETWRIPTARLRGLTIPVKRGKNSDAERFLAACHLRLEYRLPRHVFVKIPGEPKPVYVDWESPLLVRQLGRVCARTDGHIEVSEMLPTPDQRWLEVDGRRYTSELRCTVFSAGNSD